MLKPYYRRDLLIGACTYCLQRQENTHLLYVRMHLLAVIRMWLLESGASVRAFMTCGHKSTNLTRV